MLYLYLVRYRGNNFIFLLTIICHLNFGLYIYIYFFIQSSQINLNRTPTKYNFPRYYIFRIIYYVKRIFKIFLSRIMTCKPKNYLYVYIIHFYFILRDCYNIISQYLCEFPFFRKK